MSAQSQHHVLKNCVGNLCCALEGSRGTTLAVSVERGNKEKE